jgi:adenosylcobinamide kinase/adenosylcobinamide-phosphate guanylyltransferase
MFTFVTGGLRAGKSEYSLRRASELGPPPWLYVAAHIDGDDELKARLARHRRDQEATWKLIEAPPKLGDALEPAALGGHGAAVIDRFTVWLSNRLADAADKRSDTDLLAEVEVLADRLYRSTTPIVLVTTEIGLGFLPASVPDRRLINVAGLANQILSERAQSVVMMVSGVALRLR